MCFPFFRIGSVHFNSCLDTPLRNYYIKAATEMHEQNRLLLEIYKEKMINQHSKAEIPQLSMNVHYLMQQNKCRTSAMKIEVY
jgi:hypothetical protein